FIQRHAFQEEIDVRDAVLLCELAIERVEAFCVRRPVAGGYAHADQHDLRSSCFRALDEGIEIRLDLSQGQSSETIIAAELEHDDARTVNLQRAWQPCARTSGRLAARASIHDAVTVTFLDQPAFEQCDPCGLHIDAVPSAQAVPDDQYDWFVFAR